MEESHLRLSLSQASQVVESRELEHFWKAVALLMNIECSVQQTAEKEEIKRSSLQGQFLKSQ